MVSATCVRLKRLFARSVPMPGSSPARLRSPQPMGSCCPGSAISAVVARLFRTAGFGGQPLDAATSGRPFLGICVGMQLLYEGSEESPGVPGLSIFEGTVALLPEGVRRPQMQWNLLDVRPGGRLLAGYEHDAWAYFVHSYAPPVGEETVATCDYGGSVRGSRRTRPPCGPPSSTRRNPRRSALA